MPANHLILREGTSDGVVVDSHFSGGPATDGTWIDVRGNGYLLQDNGGGPDLTFEVHDPVENGYETNAVLSGWGCGNVFDGNSADLAGVGQYGIRIHEPVSDCAGNPNVVYDNNVVIDAVIGVSNVPLTPAPPE